jgi:hypothetical protein
MLQRFYLFCFFFLSLDLCNDDNTLAVTIRGHHLRGKSKKSSYNNM